MLKLLSHFYSNKPKSFLPPKIQCHRGYWVSGIQQNSLASVKSAFELGYKMAEFDVRITADKHLILFHDDLIGLNKVSEMTLTEVSAHQLVDSFESIIAWFVTVKNSGFHLNIEIKSKSATDRTLESKVLEIINKFDVADRVLISSFNPLSLFYFRIHKPDLLRALLLTYENEPGNTLMIQSQFLNILAYPHFLHLNEKYWSETRFECLLKKGVSIVLWTCNDLEKVKNYFSQGVCSVISDTLKPSDL